MNKLNYGILYFDGEGDDTNNQSTQQSAQAQPQQQQQQAQNQNKPDQNDDRNKPKYSDADLDRIIEKKLAKWQKQKEAEVNEATRLANMTAQERAEAERDKFKKELDELKKANTRNELTNEARKIISESGIAISENVLKMLIGEDAETTSATVKAYIADAKKMVQAETKKQLSHKSPSVGSASTLTKEDIMKVKDPIARQKLIKENMSLFRKK